MLASRPKLTCNASRMNNRSCVNSTKWAPTFAKVNPHTVQPDDNSTTALAACYLATRATARADLGVRMRVPLPCNQANSTR